MQPLTTGVDMEVPLRAVYKDLTWISLLKYLPNDGNTGLLAGIQLVTLEPGATISGFLIQELVGPRPE